MQYYQTILSDVGHHRFWIRSQDNIQMVGEVPPNILHLQVKFCLRPNICDFLLLLGNNRYLSNVRLFSLIWLLFSPQFLIAWQMGQNPDFLLVWEDRYLLEANQPMISIFYILLYKILLFVPPFLYIFLSYFTFLRILWIQSLFQLFWQ